DADRRVRRQRRARNRVWIDGRARLAVRPGRADLRPDELIVVVSRRHRVLPQPIEVLTDAAFQHGRSLPRQVIRNRETRPEVEPRVAVFLSLEAGDAVAVPAQAVVDRQTLVHGPRILRECRDVAVIAHETGWPECLRERGVAADQEIRDRREGVRAALRPLIAQVLEIGPHHVAAELDAVFDLNIVVEYTPWTGRVNMSSRM